MALQGKFIVIEGTDGSGKTEQTLLLVERLRKEGREVVPFDFPRYDQPSSWFVQEYLNGRFGTLAEIDPKTASLFYALDRYAAAPEIRAALAQGATVVSNRYVASNLGHQGGKFPNPEERRAYFEWDRELEFRINNIPRPDANIVLFVPPATAQTLVGQKTARRYLFGKKRDLHEADLDHLTRSYESYRDLVRLYPNEFFPVECVENGVLLPIENIQARIWDVTTKIFGK
jgi:dTMP kinase